MKGRRVLFGVAAALALGLGGFGAWLLRLPDSTTTAEAPPVDNREMTAILEALQPPKRQRPVIAVIGINDATETTDYLVPTSILRRADVADVVLVATAAGPVTLFPALTVRADATVGEFDTQYPDGADYILVPAMSRDDDPAALHWIRSQAAKGAIILGVCAGAKVVGAAGLLDGKRTTTHWYYLPELRRNTPRAIYVPDRRFVVDAGVATTTGITASLPFSLTLIEAIAGRPRAEAVARQLGITQWDARHDSDAFALTRPFALTVMGNVVAFWKRETVGIELSPAIDEMWLALVADAWSRTYRSRAVTFANAAAEVESQNSVRIVPDRPSPPSADHLVTYRGHRPALAVDEVLAAIGERYGTATARVVAMQLEYPARDTR